MSSPHDRICRAPDLRMRPVPELGHCLVFTPSRPQLYTLNPQAWLLLELCRGQARAALELEFEQAYRDANPCAATLPDLHAVLDDLRDKGILLLQPTEEVFP